MKIRRYFGKDMREALRLVKEELGEEAVIMSNRKVSDGVELVAAYDKEPAPVIRPLRKDSTDSEDQTVPSLSEIIGDDGPENLKALLAQQAKAKAVQQHSVQQGIRSNTSSDANNEQPVASELTDSNNLGHNDKTESFRATSSHSQTHQSSDKKALTHIKDELATLRQVLQYQVADLFEAKKRRHNPIRGFVTKQLLGLGLSYPLANQLADFIPGEATEREAWRYVLQLLVNRLNLAGNNILSDAGVVALMGPTGTGKTTTIAKLAARYAKKHGADSVALVTIDTYRIGAFEQLQTYGKIIGCTVKRAENAQMLSDVLFQLRHKKMIFIDTAGFSQRDSRLLSQLEQLAQSGVEIKRYLTLQANTQYPALAHTVQGYSRHQVDGCILTKIDECFSLGEVLSIAVENNLPLSFVTDGQKVPEDIKPADAKSLVTIAAKLYKKYGLNHTSGNIQNSTSKAV